MENLKILQFKNELVGHINNFGMPLLVKKMVIAEILHELEKVCDEQIKEEIKAFNEAKEKEESEENVNVN